MKKKKLKNILKFFAFGTLFLAAGLWAFHSNIHSHAHEKVTHADCLLCHHIKPTPQPISSASAVSPVLRDGGVVVLPQENLACLISLLPARSPRAPPSLALA
jgi:hypothetical protein